MVKQVEYKNIERLKHMARVWHHWICTIYFFLASDLYCYIVIQAYLQLVFVNQVPTDLHNQCQLQYMFFLLIFNKLKLTTVNCNIF